MNNLKVKIKIEKHKKYTKKQIVQNPPLNILKFRGEISISFPIISLNFSIFHLESTFNGKSKFSDGGLLTRIETLFLEFTKNKYAGDSHGGKSVFLSKYSLQPGKK